MPIQYLVRLLNLVNFTSKSHATVAMAGGPGKSTYTFSTKRLPLSAPRQASVGRASRWGGAESGRRSAENIYIDLPGPNGSGKGLHIGWRGTSSFCSLAQSNQGKSSQCQYNRLLLEQLGRYNSPMVTPLYSCFFAGDQAHVDHCILGHSNLSGLRHLLQNQVSHFAYTAFGRMTLLLMSFC